MGNDCGKQTQDDKYHHRGIPYRKQDGRSKRFRKEGFPHVILLKHDVCTAIQERDQAIAQYYSSCSRLKQKLLEADETNSKLQHEKSKLLSDIRRLEKETSKVQKQTENIQTRKLPETDEINRQLQREKDKNARQEQEINDLREKNSEILTRKLAEVEEIGLRLQREKNKNARQEQEIKDLREKNSEILTRLSAMASAKLTDGNANIADLSDKNRPTKLAEQFSELYDNEWTDAFGRLTNSNKHSEEETYEVLLSILCKTYRECKDLSVKEMDTLLSAFQAFSEGQETPSEVLKMFKDIRKKTPKDAMTILKDTKLNIYLAELLPQEQDRRDVYPFFDKCLQLCWLMVVQDPSVYIDTERSLINERFDGNTHKPYTKSGSLIDFVVWPTLFLCKGGGILAKGVVQCKSYTTPVSPKTEKWSYSRRDIKSESYEANEKENLGVSKEIRPKSGHNDSHGHFNLATSQTLGKKNLNKSGQEGSFRTLIDTRKFRGTRSHPS